MQAVILAAGMGKRLKKYTEKNTKCMVEVNGVTLIERMLRILDLKGLDRIIIVSGYARENLEAFVPTLKINTPVIFIQNEIYDRTNNIYSLLLAKDYLVSEDTLLLESDLIFDESVIDVLLEDKRDTLALVDKFASWMDGTCMKLGPEDEISEFIPGKYLRFDEEESYYKTVNIYKFSKRFSAKIYIPFLEAYIKAMGENEYYESVIKLIAMLEGSGIRAKRLSGQKWYEIDDEQDLDIASGLFADEHDSYRSVTSRYGGFWRYPRLLDYCYLVNPYFPSQKMMEEMKASFNELMCGYPSGMRVNTMLAARYFDLDPEYVLVANGAAELILALMNSINGKLGLIRPVFEEYPNRYKGEMLVYRSKKDDFSYSAEDIKGYFSEYKPDWLLVVNPDNPSGNYISYRDMRDLVSWCGENGIRLVVDESFVDFADEAEEKEVSLLADGILKENRHLYVIKSISKSYGVPGVRLGVLASADNTILNELKSELPIWNINSFAEYYMQIFGKYREDYREALRKFRMARRKMKDELQDIRWIKVFESEANYFMCEITGGITASELADSLYRDDILIKDLTTKIGNGRQYIRLAIRTEEENEYLIKRMKR